MPNTEQLGFHEEIQKMKKDSLERNIPDSQQSKIRAKDFFKDIEVDADSLRKFYESNDMSAWAVEGKVPYFNFSKGKEELKKEIMVKGPFKNPLELATAISSYVKQHMNYDFLAALFSNYMEYSPNGNKDFKTYFYNKQKETNKSLDALGFYKNKEPIIEALDNRMADLVFAETKEGREIAEKDRASKESIGNPDQVKENKSSKFLSANPEKELQAIKDFIDLIQSGAEDKEIMDFILSNVENLGATLREVILKNDKVTDEHKDAEIADILKEVQIGVCRHFSLIAKMLYEDLAKDQPNFPQSEMLYVINPSEGHAYNLLMREENGAVKKQYLDITKFMSTNSLLQKTGDKEIYGTDKEIYVKKNVNGELFNKTA